MLLPPSPLPSLPINSSHPSPLVSAISYIPLFHINFFSLQIPLFLQTVPSTQPTSHAVNFVVIISPHTQILKKTWQESQVSCNFCVLDHSYNLGAFNKQLFGMQSSKKNIQSFFKYPGTVANGRNSHMTVKKFEATASRHFFWK